MRTRCAQDSCLPSRLVNSSYIMPDVQISAETRQTLYTCHIPLDRPSHTLLLNVLNISTRDDAEALWLRRPNQQLRRISRRREYRGLYRSRCARSGIDTATSYCAYCTYVKILYNILPVRFLRPLVLVCGQLDVGDLNADDLVDSSDELGDTLVSARPRSLMGLSSPAHHKPSQFRMKRKKRNAPRSYPTPSAARTPSPSPQPSPR